MRRISLTYFPLGPVILAALFCFPMSYGLFFPKGPSRGYPEQTARSESHRSNMWEPESAGPLQTQRLGPSGSSSVGRRILNSGGGHHFGGVSLQRIDTTIQRSSGASPAALLRLQRPQQQQQLEAASAQHLLSSSATITGKVYDRVYLHFSI